MMHVMLYCRAGTSRFLGSYWEEVYHWIIWVTVPESEAFAELHRAPEVDGNWIKKKLLATDDERLALL